ncbi:hypothetical protein T4B_3813 [Trichinella pseudospiralis]|uniref:Uncharacterized protein n=1 Tax=Trichinella pseudospiralis TaxID=6337 RepID=A0A0V1I9H5_TRIPS|nr:hypothetical protein T4A_740 [Trichinella pseudospiralis]KRZ19501.1 hypothetical protein T4B_3813 [Trichinella pseudospiralis]
MITTDHGLRVFLPDVVNGRRSGKAELIRNHDAVSFGYILGCVRFGLPIGLGVICCDGRMSSSKRVGGCKVNSDGDNPDERNKAVAEPSAETADLLHATDRDGTMRCADFGEVACLAFADVYLETEVEDH